MLKGVSSPQKSDLDLGKIGAEHSAVKERKVFQANYVYHGKFMLNVNSNLNMNAKLALFLTTPCKTWSTHLIVVQADFLK